MTNSKRLMGSLVALATLVALAAEPTVVEAQRRRAGRRVGRSVARVVVPVYRPYYGFGFRYGPNPYNYYYPGYYYRLFVVLNAGISGC